MIGSSLPRHQSNGVQLGSAADAPGAPRYAVVIARAPLTSTLGDMAILFFIFAVLATLFLGGALLIGGMYRPSLSEFAPPFIFGLGFSCAGMVYGFLINKARSWVDGIGGFLCALVSLPYIFISAHLVHDFVSELFR